MTPDRRRDRYGLEIRAATAADAPGLVDLMDAADGPAALAARLDAFRDASGIVLVAVEWGPPSGLVALNRVRTLTDDLPVGQIGCLVVGPEQRQRGVARLLLKAASQAARAAGCGSLHLIVPPADPGARGFAEATGFAEIGAVYVRSLRKRSAF